jgi:hypothetical protein
MLILNSLYPFHLPLTPEWDEKKDIFAQSSMMGAGAGMFLKNPLYVPSSSTLALTLQTANVNVTRLIEWFGEESSLQSWL